MMNDTIKETARLMLAMMVPDPRIIDLPDGGEIHGRFQSNYEQVHIKGSDGVMFIAVGEIPEYGSEPLTPTQAFVKFVKAARR